MKRITAIVGHYGSGKTEFSVNLVMDLKKQYEKVAILDMDIANPYFRSRERQAFLEEQGIDIHHNSFGYDITEDLPALSATLKAPLENKEFITVADIGGDDSGARVLNQFRKYFITEESTMLCVINANRPETDHVEGAVSHIQRIQMETGIKIDGLINNTHLLRETTVDEVIKGYELCREISQQLEIPIVYNTCVRSLCPELEKAVEQRGFTEFTIYPITLYMRPTWLDSQESNWGHRI